MRKVRSKSRWNSSISPSATVGPIISKNTMPRSPGGSTGIMMRWVQRRRSGSRRRPGQPNDPGGEIVNLRRRDLFFLAAGTLLRAEDRAKRDMVVRSVRPEDLEMPLSGFSDYLTPIEHFFVRTHVYVPSVNAADWRLQVTGEVAQPLSLSLEDVKKLPPVE